MREPVTTMEATSATSSFADWANAGVAAMKLRAAPPIMVEASKDSRTILFFKKRPSPEQNKPPSPLERRGRSTARGTSRPFALRAGHYGEACHKQVGITSIMAQTRTKNRQMNDI